MIVLSIGVPGGSEEPKNSSDPLKDGILYEGSASANTGKAWMNTSEGTSYGDGTRFDREETAYMTKIPSKART